MKFEKPNEWKIAVQFKLHAYVSLGQNRQV